MKRKISRRSFMIMTGGTGAAIMFKPGEQFLHKLISYVNPPSYPKPGEWAYYTTTCRECPAGCGLLMWHRDGRVTKADGNPLHPINLGKLCIRGQSAVQGEYNPDRLTKVLQKDEKGNFQETDWTKALTSIRKELASGKKAAVISDLQTGSLAEVITSFSAKHGTTPPLFYEPLNYESLRQANKEMYGEDLIPHYNLKDCDLIVSFGAAFLETWLSPVEYARDFGEMHSFKENNIGKLIYVGPAETLTALNADEFILISPGSETDIIFGIVHLLAEKGFFTRVQTEGYSLPPHNPSGPNAKAIEKIANEIMRAKTPLILAGSPEDTTSEGTLAVKAANLLNEWLGNRDRIDFTHFHSLSKTASRDEAMRFFRSLTTDHLLVILNTNPVYSLNEIDKYIQKAGKVVYIGNTRNETSDLADWILPSNFYLEDWGDYESREGHISLMQPVMRPIFDTRSAGDIFLQLTGETTENTFKETVRNNWKSWLGEQQNSRENGQEVDAFREMLQKGYLDYTPATKNLVIKTRQFESHNPAEPSTDSFFLYATSSLFFYDGRLSNRPWLQEISDPVSNVAWQSWLDMNTEKARIENIEEGDIVKVTSVSGSLEVAVRLTDKITDNTVGLKIGQGHRQSENPADDTGVNAFVLLPIDKTTSLPFVKLEKTGKKEPLLYLNETKDQNGRELLKEVTLESLQAGTAEKEEITWPTPQGYDKDKDLYKPHEHKNHRWGMVIDLQACIGCKACEAACYAENNIPVVGKKNCRDGKEMSWLKVPPYYIKNNKTAFIPVPCQHCDAAPCEPVCPVFASVHTEEGLNAQIYNRCVGTRYCSNNCPYKVRRFNWSNVKHDYPMNLQLNPEVTVRERGVMEKCTFCVQRIRNAEDKAKIENRKLRDGEVVTACQQTCPTGAIVFGDMNDADSRVKKLMNHERRYQLLRELNTKPAVIYLKKINLNT